MARPPKLPADPRHTEYLPLDQIRPADRNPKRHDLAAIKRSIARFGFVAPPVLDERTGQLVAGHGRLQTLADMRDDGEAPPAGVKLAPDGAWLVPVQRGWASRSDAEADAYLVTDNRLTEVAGWDNTALAELLSGLREVDTELLEAAGYTPDEVEDLLKLAAPPDLDDLAGDVGEPEPGDGWPTLRIKVPHHLASAWEGHLDQHGDDAPAAFAALLGLDPTPPPPPQWNPDLRPDL